MDREDAYLGQEVTWIKKWPWPSVQCRIEQIYGRQVRVFYKDHNYRLQHKYVSMNKLLPGHLDLSETELKKILNPNYDRKPKSKIECDED